jgi:hypothetical protein
VAPVAPALRRRARRTIAAALLVGLGATAQACDTSGGDAEKPIPSSPRTIVVTPIPLPSGVRLSFVQQRIDEGTRRAEVRVQNGTDRPVRVREVGIDWAGFPLHLQRFPYVVGPQSTVDLPYRLPPAVCGAAVVRAPIVGVAMTRSGVVRRPVEADGVRFLQRIHRAACAERRLAAAVDLRYSDRFTLVHRGGRLLLRTVLVLDRGRSRQPIRVVQVEGSVLFDLRLTGRRLLPPRATVATVPIEVRDGGRCDPHSRGQSTQTFLFRMWLRIGEGELLPRILQPTKPQQVRLLAFLDRACATAGHTGARTRQGREG